MTILHSTQIYWIYLSQGRTIPVLFRYEIDIHTTEKVVTINNIIRITQLDDYVNNNSSEIVVSATMGLGDYVLDIFPFRQNLKAVIRAIPVSSNGGELKYAAQRYQEMRVVLAENEDISVKSGGSSGRDREEMNQAAIIPFNFQLISPITNQARQYSVEGIRVNTEITDLLLEVLTIPPLVGGCNIVPPTNVNTITQLIIPAGITVMDFPGWLQNDSGIGVYNAELNWYMQNNQWYVFPLYDTTRYTTESDVLTICNVPKERLPNPEKTYFYKEGELYILATGNTNFKDLTDIYQLTNGNASRFTIANALENSSVTESNGDVFLSKELSNVNVLSELREDGSQIGYYNRTTPTNNVAREMSRIAGQRGIIVTLEWVNADSNYSNLQCLVGFYMKKEVVLPRCTGLS